MNIIPFSCQRDGLTIRGTVLGDACPGRHAVILCHGFLANELSVRQEAEFLAQTGYLAVSFDFCGGGPDSRSDGDPADMTVLTEKEDLLSVIAAVRAQFRPASLSLLGMSQGGFVCALTAADPRAGEILCLSLYFPALCIPDDARSGHLLLYHFDPEHMPDLLGDRPMRLGSCYALAVRDMDPYREIAGYDGPVLLVHGTADPIVNVRYSRRAKDVYRHCEYHEIEGAEHAFMGEHGETVRGLLGRFLKEQTGGNQHGDPA